MQGQAVADMGAMCLDIKDGNYVDGDVQMWQCVDGNTNQMWETEWVKEMWF